MQFNGQFIGSNTPIYFNGRVPDTVVALEGSWKLQWARIPPKYINPPTYEQALTLDWDYPDGTVGDSYKQPAYRWIWEGDTNNRFNGANPLAFFDSYAWDGTSSTHADSFGVTWNINGNYEKTARGTVRLNGGSISINSIPRSGDTMTRLIKIVILPDWDNLPHHFGSTSYNKYYSLYDCVGANGSWGRNRNGNAVLIGEGQRRTGTANGNAGWDVKILRRSHYTSNEYSYGGYWSNWWYSNDYKWGTGVLFRDTMPAGEGKRFITHVVKEGNGVDYDRKRVSVYSHEHNSRYADRTTDRITGGLSTSGRTFLVQDNVRMNFGGSNWNTYGNTGLTEEFYGEIAQITVWDVPHATDMFYSNVTEAGHATVSQLHGRYHQCRLLEEQIRNGTL